MTKASPVSEIFDDTFWRAVPGFEEPDDITYHLYDVHDHSTEAAGLNAVIGCSTRTWLH